MAVTLLESAIVDLRNPATLLVLRIFPGLNLGGPVSNWSGSFSDPRRKLRILEHPLTYGVNDISGSSLATLSELTSSPKDR